MSISPAIVGDPVVQRLKNRNLQQRTLEPTPENRKIVHEYNALAEAINTIPQRIAGLHMNYRRREIPHRVYMLMAERDEKMARLLELEKTLLPKDLTDKQP